MRCISVGFRYYLVASNPLSVLLEVVQPAAKPRGGGGLLYDSAFGYSADEEEPARARGLLLYETEEPKSGVDGGSGSSAAERCAE